VPLIDGSLLNVECRIVGRQTLFSGEAVWARFDPEKRPLLYHDGKYRHPGGRVAKEGDGRGAPPPGRVRSAPPASILRTANAPEGARAVP
jgi:hypothetical protein